MKDRPTIQRQATPIAQTFKNLLIGELCGADFCIHPCLVEQRKEPVLPGMVGNLEKGIPNELGSAFWMGEQPLSASEEGCRNLMLAKEVDDVSLVSGDLEGLLAKVECEGDEFLARRQFNTTKNLASRLEAGRGSRRAAGRHRAMGMPGYGHFRFSLSPQQLSGRPAVVSNFAVGLRLKWECGRKPVGNQAETQPKQHVDCSACDGPGRWFGDEALFHHLILLLRKPQPSS